MEKTLLTMGATEEQLRELHTFADKERARQQASESENAEKLELMRNELKLAAAPFGALWKKMDDGENISVPADEDNYLVMEKMGNTIRMAVTKQDHQPLSGYVPDFGPIGRFQSVEFDWWVGRDPQAVSIDHFDGDQIRQYTSGEASYAEARDRIQTGAFRDVPPDVVVDSFRKLDRIITVPMESAAE